jgi:hypothetical protein
MKVGTEVLVQPQTFYDDIQEPVVAETIEPAGTIRNESKVAIKVKSSYRWTHSNCFIVNKKYCVIR